MLDRIGGDRSTSIERDEQTCLLCSRPCEDAVSCVTAGARLGRTAATLEDHHRGAACNGGSGDASRRDHQVGERAGFENLDSRFLEPRSPRACIIKGHGSPRRTG